jgi:hypothetical protein
LESENCIQWPSILVVVDVTVPNCFPHVPHLEPYTHHRDPLDIVGLGEGRPPAAGTDVPNNGLDPVVTMVPVRGGRVAPTVKIMISVNPAIATPPTQSTVGVSVSICAAATTPLGVRGCPLCCLLSCCLPHQLELIVSVIVGRNRAVGATGA